MADFYGVHPNNLLGLITEGAPLLAFEKWPFDAVRGKPTSFFF